MKKCFTMIELIFVIVILGILASVAVPRLAGTKADAEISAAVANLRTLVNDANVYYVAHGTFTDATWNDVTNVPIKDNGGLHATTKLVTDTKPAALYIGGDMCIEVSLSNGFANLNIPAYITFTRNPKNKDKGVCKEVLAAEPIKAYFESEVTKGLRGTTAVGSSKGVYSKAK